MISAKGRPVFAFAYFQIWCKLQYTLTSTIYNGESSDDGQLSESLNQQNIAQASNVIYNNFVLSGRVHTVDTLQLV